MEIAIEFFPLKKSCAQGCKPCPMATQGKPMTEGVIDSNAQESFTVLEKVLKNYNKKYDLHFASEIENRSDLFPKLKYPNLINMARFETNKGIMINDAKRNVVEEFSNGIKKILLENKINPKIIGFSFVPQHPIVNHKDTLLVGSIIQQIKEWYFKNNSKTIEATIRSNLIELDLFKSINPILFKNDEKFLKQILQDIVIDGHPIYCSFNEKLNGNLISNIFMYHNEYRVNVSKDTIILKNRVIATEKREVATLNYDQAVNTIMWKDVCDFAIAPKGVMLMHSSAFINNPILWLTHEDFRTEILKRNLKKDFDLKIFIDQIIQENIVMYDYINQTYKNTKVSNSEWAKLFQTNRQQIYNVLSKESKKVKI